jgi:hypothetical protein
MNDQESSRAIEVIARDCIAVRLRLLNRVVTNLYDEALRPLWARAQDKVLRELGAKAWDDAQRRLTRVFHVVVNKRRHGSRRRRVSSMT